MMTRRSTSLGVAALWMTLATWSGSVAAPAPASFRLGPQQLATARIVVPADADHMKLFAARELQTHLRLVLGTELTIVADGKYRDGAFLVGMRPATDRRPLATEEGRYLVTPGAVYLYGDDRVRMSGADPLHSSIGYRAGYNLGGTQFAVYDFLERELGIRWLEPGPDGVVYTPRPQLEIPVGSHNWVSPFPYERGMRSGNWRHTSSDPGFIPAAFVSTPEQARAHRQELDLWLRRMRMGGKEPLRFSHGFSDWWEKYGAEHPEYFALTGRGERRPLFNDAPDRVKICPSAPGVVKQVVADWLERRQDRVFGNRAVCVAVNDGGGGGASEYCHCDSCLALDVRRPGEAFGQHLTDRYLYLANQTLKAARAHVPDALVTAYAYAVTLQPPRREHVAQGVVLEFVTAMNKPFSETRRLYADWKKMGLTQFLFRPNDLYMELGLPLGQGERWFRHQQLVIQEGALGIDHDGVEGFWTGVSGLAYYALAKGQVDPSQDFAHWEEEYTAAFGAAQPQVRDYYRYWRRKFSEQIYPADLQVQASGDGEGFLHWHGLGYVSARIQQFYSRDDFTRTDSLLQVGWARDLTPVQRHQLRRLILANEHARLTFQAMAAVQDQDDARILDRARELLDFRVAYQDSLRMNWWQLFAEQHYMGDATGIALLLHQKKLAGRKSFRCAAISTPPVLDGSLRDAAWAAARNGVGFLTNASAAVPRAATEALLTHDAENLYLAVECQEPHIDAVVERETRRDGAVWLDNAVEFFVDPDNTGDHLTQFIITSSGVLFDGRQQEGGFSEAWNLEVGTELEYAVGKTDSSWVLELRVPFRSLGVPVPVAGTHLRFNVNRDRAVVGEKPEQTALSPTFGLFHMPQRFAELRFQ